jgi:hypothetical protein
LIILGIKPLSWTNVVLSIYGQFFRRFAPMNKTNWFISINNGFPYTISQVRRLLWGMDIGHASLLCFLGL